jgi:ubiquinone biosynthesis protein
VQIEGLGRVLYPDLDIWQTGKPVLKAWMLDQTGPKGTLRQLRRDWPDLRYALEQLPQVARKLVDGALQPGPIPPVLAAQAETLPARRSRHGAVAGAALLVSASVWLGLDTPPDWLGWALGAVGLLSLWFTRPK